MKYLGWSLRFFGLLAFSLALVMAPLGCRKREERKAPPPSVFVTEVGERDLSDSETIIGQTVADLDVALIARVSGYLRKRHFQEGAMVKKGDLLFTIEPEEYKAKVKSAKAAVMGAQAEQLEAKIEFDRTKRLFEKKAASQKDFDQATSAKASADAKLLSAQADLDQANLNLGYTEIKAPFDGRIGKVNYDIGSLVGTDSGELARIVSMDPMKVDFNINESLLTSNLEKTIQRIKAQGKDVQEQIRRVTSVGPEEKEQSNLLWLILSNGNKYPHAGFIDFWASQVSSNTGTVMVRGEVPNPDFLLLPGQYVKVVIESKVKTKRLIIPLQAVQQDQQGKYVLVVDGDSKVSVRRIKTGQQVGDSTVVTKGLKAGERIISQGVQKVRPGQIVDAHDAKTEESDNR